MKKISLILLLAVLAIPVMQANVDKDGLFRTKMNRNSTAQMQYNPVVNSNWGAFASTMKGEVKTWDFEDEAQIADWTFVDNDGDGYNWQYFNMTGVTSGRMSPHGGEGLMASASYNKDLSLALNPDNWMISPIVELGGVLSLWAAGQDPDYSDETFAVYVCVGTPTGIADFVKVGPDVMVTGEYVEYSFDLTAYNGQQGCFAIRHYNTYDMFWLNIDDITLDPNAIPPAPIAETPVIVNVDPTATTANVAWENENATSWDLRYRVYNPNMAQNILWDFETPEQVNEWIKIDADGDGYNWYDYSDSYYAHSGDVCMMSASYSYGALTPDNWLMSPVVTLGGELKFWAGPVLSSWPDVFAVYVSVGEGTEVENFELISEDFAPTAWTEYTFDLSDYAGMEGRFAIRHYNCTDQYRLRVDDVSYAVPGDEPNEWVYVYGIDQANYTIEGLDPETTYEVQVMGYNADGIATAWSDMARFTTLTGDVDGQCLAPNSSYEITGTEIATVTIVNREEGATVNYEVYCNGVLIETGSFTGDEYSFDVTGAGNYVIHAIATKQGKEDSFDGGVFFTILEGEGLTGINELNNGKNVASVRYFNAMGQEMQSANGMTIVVTTYTDGTTSTAKVMK